MNTATAMIPSLIELLEARIAPASLVFTDLDGDKVTFTTSTADLDVNTATAPDGLHSVFTIYFTGAEIEGTNLTVAVSKGKVGNVPGDGKVIIGSIQGGTNNLGKIKIAGDLGDIDAGSGSGTIAAIKSLTVDSFGRFGQRGEDDAYSQINGNVGSLVVKGDFIETNFYVTGNLASASIGGSVIGGKLGGEGQIYATGDLGKVTIKKDLRGGSGDFTGIVAAGHDIGSVAIGGSIYGGEGDNSGNILAAFLTPGTLTKVTVGGSIIGGTGQASGAIGNGSTITISKQLDIGSITVGKDLVGGQGPDSGVISALAGGALKTLKIKGAIVGGNSDSSGKVTADEIGTLTVGSSIYGGKGSASGAILATHIDSLSIGGSIFGGEGQISGRVFAALEGIDVLKIRGDVRGSTGNDSGQVITSGKTDKRTIGGAVIRGTGADSGIVN